MHQVSKNTIILDLLCWKF